jgi:hypothetical protein
MEKTRQTVNIQNISFKGIESFASAPYQEKAPQQAGVHPVKKRNAKHAVKKSVNTLVIVSIIALGLYLLQVYEPSIKASLHTYGHGEDFPLVKLGVGFGLSLFFMLSLPRSRYGIFGLGLMVLWGLFQCYLGLKAIKAWQLFFPGSFLRFLFRLEYFPGVIGVVAGMVVGGWTEVILQFIHSIWRKK